MYTGNRAGDVAVSARRSNLGRSGFHTAVWAFTLVTAARRVTVGDLGPRGTSRDLGPKNRELGSEVEITGIRTEISRLRARSVEVGRGWREVAGLARISDPKFGHNLRITWEVTLQYPLGTPAISRRHPPPEQSGNN